MITLFQLQVVRQKGCNASGRAAIRQPNAMTVKMAKGAKDEEDI
jgi:hypothetical protein